MGKTRYEAGWDNAEALYKGLGDMLKEKMKPITPDFADYIIEFPFGDIYSREGLDIKTRELAFISALAVRQNCQPQLEIHIEGALNIGCTPQQIVEVLLQTCICAGFPSAMNALMVAQQVFEKCNVTV